MRAAAPVVPRRSASRWLAASALALLVVGLGASAALEVALLPQHPDLADLREASLLLAHLSLFHIALLAPVALGTMGLLALLAARRGSAPTPRAAFLHVAGTSLAWLLVVNAILRFTISYAPLRGGSKSYATPLTLVNLVVFPFGVLVVFALCWILTSSGWSRSLRVRRSGVLVAVYLAVLGFTLGVNLVAERPERPEIAALSGPAFEEPAHPDDATAESALVLGIDGLSWHVIKALLLQGELPHFAALVEQGARANFETIIPTYSPIIWTTIATGRHHDVHGIRGFTRFRLPGMSAHLETAPLVSSINWVNGLNRALSIAADRGLVEQAPVFNVERRVPALWDVATHFGVRAGVHQWLGTWPVTPLEAGSFMVSGPDDRPGAWHPEDAVRHVLEEAGAAAEAAPGAPCSTHAQSAQAATALYRHFQPRLAMAWISVDGVQHQSWRGAFGYDWLVRPSRVSHSRFAPEILECYRRADAAVGAWRETLGPRGILIVVSDHGYSFDGYEHHFAPQGVFLAAGPGIVPGTLLDSVTIYDVAPTVLRILGLPVSQELEGRAVEEMFRPGSLPDLRSVAAYSWYEAPELQAERAPDLEREAIEALKSLGYVN